MQNHISKTLLLAFSCFILMTSLSVSCTAETNKDPDSSFPQFWKDFRNSVLNNDIENILKMTRFPFQVKGDLDMLGSKTLAKDQFLKQFNEFMDQDTRENLTPESMRDYIKNNANVYPNIEDGQTDIGLFSFEYINNKWYFVRVYVEEL